MPVPVVRAKIRRWTVLGKQLAQRLQNIVRLKPASHHDRQALPAVLIQHRQHLERPSIMRPVRPRSHTPIRGVGTGAAVGYKNRRSATALVQPTLMVYTMAYTDG